MYFKLDGRGLYPGAGFLLENVVFAIQSSQKSIDILALTNWQSIKELSLLTQMRLKHLV